MEGANDQVTIREATPADVESLTHRRPPRGLHADRVGTESDRKYVLAEVDGKPAGFGVIHFKGDPAWDRPEQVPLVMDLYVAPNLRKRGIGSRVLRALEKSARERGFSCVYLQVQPEKNRNAIEMYRRQGYQQLSAKPYPDPYQTVDEQGNVQEGTELIVDMRKLLD
jgi:ribosomal protein S18 acetylase RimI-like enzyme